MTKTEKISAKIKEIQIVIERSNDAYGSYAENVEAIYGQGDTLEEAKQSALDTIELLKKYNTPENIPATLKGDYKVAFKFDTESFLSLL